MVYVAFETKSGLLRALWNLLLRGDEEGVPVAARPWCREALDEPDPERQLLLVARNSRHVKQRIGAVLEVIRAAAPTDPDIQALWDRIELGFHANRRVIVESLAGRPSSTSNSSRTSPAASSSGRDRFEPHAGEALRWRPHDPACRRL